MFLTARKMPPELLHSIALGYRKTLSVEEDRALYIARHGFDGENLYDKLFDEAGHANLLIFRDIYLGKEKSGAQYDSIIISGDQLSVNEIKNYRGSYDYQGGRFVKNGDVVGDNAYIHLERSIGKLYGIFRKARMPVNIAGKVIFVNDDFRLSTDDDSIWKKSVIRMDLKRYFRSFQNEWNTAFADRIADVVKSRIIENPYFDSCADMDALRKGLYCGACGGFSLEKGRFQLTCRRCGTIESNETHLLRVMSDYKYLFHNKPMTKRGILNLIDYQLNPMTVLRSLQKHCNVIKNSRSTYYVFKYYDFEEAMEETKHKKRYKDKLMVHR